MKSTLIRHRLVFLLLGALALGGWLSHGFVHPPGDSHETTCSLCVIGVSIDLPHIGEILACINPALEFAVLLPATDFIPTSLYVPGLFSPRGPPLG